MRLFEALLGMLGMAGSLLTLGVVFLGIPWALVTLARMSRATDEILRTQREMLRELRRARADVGREEPAEPEPK
jgi:hypothetical protein